MFDIPIFDEEYREALIYLLDELDIVKSCSEDKSPWCPKDEDKLAQALKVYKRWHPDTNKNPILDFPWPKPGCIPKVPADCLKPSDEEKQKVRDFIEKNDGPDMDPFTEAIVQLAKDLIREIH
jgi:hypothetical protein